MNFSLRSKLFSLGVILSSTIFISTSSLNEVFVNADYKNNSAEHINVESTNSQSDFSQDISNENSEWKNTNKQSDNIVDTNNNQYNDFVQKFDKAVSLSNNNMYSINYYNLPENTTSKEIQELQSIINNRNNYIENSYSNSSVTLQSASKSVVISDGQTLSDMDISDRGWFHEGSTYTRTYWWGYRVHISKSTLIQIGNAAVDAGTLIGAASYLPDSTLALLPEGLSLGAIGSAVGVVGIGLKDAPGGIVFNYSPNIGVWSVGLQ